MRKVNFCSDGDTSSASSTLVDNIISQCNSRKAGRKVLPHRCIEMYIHTEDAIACERSSEATHRTKVARYWQRDHSSAAMAPVRSYSGIDINA